MLHKDAMSASRQALADELHAGKPVLLIVKNDSMIPTLWPGDNVEIHSANSQELKQGDIILIGADDELVIHRLLAFRNIGGQIHALTRGDNTGTLDQPVRLNQILGRVRTIRRGKYATLQPDTGPANIDDALLLASFPSPDTLPPKGILSGINRDAFLTAADNEQLAPQIYLSNQQWLSCKENAQGEVAVHLKNAYMSVLARNTLFLQEFGDIAAALAGIGFVLLKGAYLAQCVYVSPGLRPFSDIDVLIRKCDLTKVHTILLAAGYSSFPKLENPMPEPAESAYLNSLMYTHNERRISLHVHWHLLNSTLPLSMSVTMNIDDIWKTTVTNSAGFMELSPEHLIIHLAEHAVRHSFDRLILLRDMAEVLDKFRTHIDWNKLASDSMKYNLCSIVYYSLLLTMRKTAVQVPEDALKALAPPKQGLGERLFMKLVDNGIRNAELGSLIHFSNSGSIGQMTRLALRMAFPPRSAMAHALNCNVDQVGAGVYIRRLSRGIKNATRAGVKILAIRSRRHHAKRTRNQVQA